MDLRPDMSAGDRLKVARRAAGLTQEQLAERSGVNVDTIRKLEQNQRHSMRVTTANALAKAVGIETTGLLLGVAEDDRADDPQLRRIREARVPAEDFVPRVDADDEDAAPDLMLLRQSVEDTWSSYHAGDFGAVGQIVPDLIMEARVAAREHTNGVAASANGVLAKALQLGSHAMVHNQA